MGHAAASFVHHLLSKETSDQIAYFHLSVERVLGHNSVKIFVKVRGPSQETAGRV